MSCATCSNNTGGTPRGCKNNGHCATGGCGKLEVYDWLAGVPLPGGQHAFDAVEVRFKNTRKAFFRSPPSMGIRTGEVVVVEAASGYDVGVVGLSGELVRAQMARKEHSGDTFELRKVLHKAAQEEIDLWHTVRQKEEETLLKTKRIAHDAGMEMKVSDVEFQGDGTKAIFYYTAEERIDFRDLVHRLADVFQVRVEMKQIGARQEAGRIGGIGSCGRELCCSTWLTDLRSVTTSAARYQQLALNPQKLAGQCGKLKCCLNYELDMYIEAIKSYPSQNAKLKTQQGTGSHLKTDIFQGRMWYMFKKTGSAPAMVGLPIDMVRDILAKNKEGEEPEVDLHYVEEPVRVEKGPDYENVVGQDELTRFDQKMKGGKSGRGGKGRKGRSASGGRPNSPRPDAAKAPDGNAKRGRGRGRGRGRKPPPKPAAS